MITNETLREPFTNPLEAADYLALTGVTVVKAALDPEAVSDSMSAIESLIAENARTNLVLGADTTVLEALETNFTADKLKDNTDFASVMLRRGAAADKVALALRSRVMSAVLSIESPLLTALFFEANVQTSYGEYAPASPETTASSSFHHDSAVVVVAEGKGFFHTLRKNSDGLYEPAASFKTETGDIAFMTQVHGPVVHAGQNTDVAKKRSVLTFDRAERIGFAPLTQNTTEQDGLMLKPMGGIIQTGMIPDELILDDPRRHN